MAEVDLVCGPADPLPESSQSFRLVERLGTGAQADVYKAVRQSAGVASAPVTVRVFRPADDRDIQAQFRSWDKGDAVLMDLGGRGVTGICRRIDAFYGPPPYRPGTSPAPHQQPYQVLEYLPGYDLRQLLPQQGRSPIDAVGVLRTLASVLDAMHRPGSTEIHPCLHMDIKASNVLMLPDGSARVIDFTGARYAAASHMTTIAYTPEAAGPEARQGRVGPSYDVHGFGSVAFYLVTGTQPRGESDEAAAQDDTSVKQLRRHPVVEANPKLRDHLMAPLADDPRDRPATVELPRWIDGLAEIVVSSHVPSLGVHWGSAVPAAQNAAATTMFNNYAPHNADTPTPTAPIPQVAGSGPAAAAPATASAPVSPAGNAPVSPGQYGRGVAAPSHASPNNTQPPPQQPQQPQEPPEPPRPWTGPNGKFSALTGGIGLSLAGALFAFVCWGITALVRGSTSLGWDFASYVLVLLVAVGVFAIARLVGTMLIVKLFKRTRRSARLSHLAAGAFLVIVGIDWLRQIQGISEFFNWVGTWF